MGAKEVKCIFEYHRSPEEMGRSDSLLSSQSSAWFKRTFELGKDTVRSTVSTAVVVSALSSRYTLCSSQAWLGERKGRTRERKAPRR